MEKKSAERWHGGHHYSNKIHLALIIFLFFTAFTFFWAYLKMHDSKIYKNIPIPTIMPVSPTPTSVSEDQVFCTMEAKLCPDGSYVGRSGPKCEFTPCP